MVDDSHRELSSRRHERGEESPGPAASELSATAVASGIRDGEFSAEDVTRSCLDRIGTRESDVGAWVNLDPDHALDQARAADERQRAGTRLGPLHGVPVGVKDIFDTTDFPTEWGSPICFGRQPIEDSAVVNRLRSAGAVILGKTVTSEFAAWRPGPTRNPHDLTRTPGGSSSGSAAAVADKMVPLAVGSQTEGSTIRPASYCGVVGFKPSFGAISRRGVMRLSPSLDHVGLFSRSVADIWLLAGSLFRAGRELVAEARGAPIRLGFVPSPFWDHATRELRDSFERYAEAARLPRVDLPPGFEDARTVRDRISSAEIAVEFGELHGRAAARLDDLFRRTIERGQAITHDELERARARQAKLATSLDDVFDDFDALVTPAATGVAGSPDTTGDPVFNSIWTLCGNPAISLPLLTGPSGLPIGVQLVGRRGRDGDLLGTAGQIIGGPPLSSS